MSEEMLPLRQSRNSGSLEGTHTHTPEDDARGLVPIPLSSTETVEEEMKKLEIGSSGKKIQSNDIPMEGACGGKDTTPEHTSQDYLDSSDIPDNGDVDKSSKKKKKKKAKRSRQATDSPGNGDPKSSDALLWENVKFFIRDTVVKQKIDGQKLSAERRIKPEEFRSKFCLPDLANFLNKEEMLRQKENVDMEIERQWQDILDEVNVDLFTDVEIFKSQLTHAFDLSIAESGWKFKATQLLVTEVHTEKMFFLKICYLFNVSCYEIMLPFVRAIPGFHDLDSETQTKLCHSPALVDCFLLMINIWYDQKKEAILFPNGMSFYHGGYFPNCKPRGGRKGDTRIGDVLETVYAFVTFYFQPLEREKHEMAILMAAILIFDERSGVLMAKNLAKIKFAIYNSIKKWCFVRHGDNYLQAFTLVVGETRAISQQISNDLKRASEGYNRK